MRRSQYLALPCAEKPERRNYYLPPFFLQENARIIIVSIQILKYILEIFHPPKECRRKIHTCRRYLFGINVVFPFSIEPWRDLNFLGNTKVAPAINYTPISPLDKRMTEIFHRTHRPWCLPSFRNGPGSGIFVGALGDVFLSLCLPLPPLPGLGLILMQCSPANPDDSK